MLVILFWAALVLAALSWVGAVAEKSTKLVTVSAVFMAVALLSAAAESASWL